MIVPTTPAPAPLAARGVAARAALLKAAAEELAETGEVEVAAVARRAGVSAGLPYRYFGTRDGLLVAVVDDFHERLADAVVFAPIEADTWAEREHERLRRWVAFLYADPLSSVVLGGVGDGEVAAAGARRLRDAVAVGGRNMAAAQATGEIDADRDPELLAAAVLGGVHTTVTLALGRRRRPRAERVVDELWRFIAGAVGLVHDDPVGGGRR